jgi:hypothetical protein
LRLLAKVVGGYTKPTQAAIPAARYVRLTYGVACELIGTSKGDYLVCDEETAMCFYSDLTKEQGQELAQAASKISQAVRVFGDEQTYDGFHKLIPSSYILTKKDILVPEPAQRQFISRLEENGGRPVPVFELDTAHSPHQTNPQLLMETLNKILEQEHGSE